MREKKKLIILTSIILGVLVVVLGVAYAAFTYDRIGNNSDLVLGDIYMHYKENNQLMFNDAMPTSIDKYTTYKVNPVMATQEIVDNELTKCINFVNSFGEGAESFCKGTGRFYGSTFQETLDNNGFPSEFLSYFEENNIILVNSDTTYKVNPIMATQEINELTACVIWYGGSEFDEGSTAESFCRGTGTISGMTLQETLDAMPEEQKNYFLESEGQKLLDAGVILEKIENLPYFEFTISGKNTYLDEDIWFEIVLNHGDNHETRTTRIKDELLRFILVEVIGEDTETILLNNKEYNDLSNKKIWVETIKANTTSEINKKYRLYAWISDSTVIGNVNEDYTTEEWDDVFASIKVNVTGDFKEKQLAYEDKYNVTDASCFETVNSKIYIANPIMTNQTVEEINELTACVKMYQGMEYEFDEGSTAESFCKGTGTASDITIQEDLNNWINAAVEYNYDFLESGGQALLDKGIIMQDGDSYIVNTIMQNQEVEEINQLTACVTHFRSNFSDEEEVKIYCRGIGEDTLSEDLYQYRIDSDELEQLKNDNIIIENQGLVITGYDRSCGSDVVIPKAINGNNVIGINNSTFSDMQLSSVVFPNTILSIRWWSFQNNNISKVNIPDSVVYLDCDAFDYSVSINAKDNLVCVNDQV